MNVKVDVISRALVDPATILYFSAPMFEKTLQKCLLNAIMVYKT